LRRKTAVYAGVLAWYALGCPQGWGMHRAPVRRSKRR
jgi:hypothetical protein